MPRQRNLISAVFTAMLRKKAEPTSKFQVDRASDSQKLSTSHCIRIRENMAFFSSYNPAQHLRTARYLLPSDTNHEDNHPQVRTRPPAGLEILAEIKRKAIKRNAIRRFFFRRQMTHDHLREVRHEDGSQRICVFRFSPLAGANVYGLLNNSGLHHAPTLSSFRYCHILRRIPFGDAQKIAIDRELRQPVLEILKYVTQAWSMTEPRPIGDLTPNRLSNRSAEQMGVTLSHQYYRRLEPALIRRNLNEREKAPRPRCWSRFNW